MITYPNGEVRRPAGTSPDTAQGTNEYFQNKPCTGSVYHLRQNLGVSFGKTPVSFFGKRAKCCPFGVNCGNTGWDTCLFRSLWLAEVTLIRVSGFGGARAGESREAHPPSIEVHRRRLPGRKRVSLQRPGLFRKKACQIPCQFWEILSFLRRERTVSVTMLLGVNWGRRSYLHSGNRTAK